MRKFLECMRISPSCTTLLSAIEWGNPCLPVALSIHPVQPMQSEHQTMHLNRSSQSKSREIPQVDVGLMNALVVETRLYVEWAQSVKVICFKTQLTKEVKGVSLDLEARKAEERAQEIDIKSQERLSIMMNLLSSMFMTDKLEVLLHRLESLAIIHVLGTLNRRQHHLRHVLLQEVQQLH